MDILAHGLWGAVGAKALNKVLERRGATARLNPWWTGFWAAFPDLLAFTLLGISIAWTAVFGTNPFDGLRTLLPISLYPLGHSLVPWAVAFGVVWLIQKRPTWELLGWLSHILIDIGTHPAEFYPTPFLWPVSELRLNGTAWATPGFLAVNYILLLSLLYRLREHRDIKEGFKAMTNTKKIFLGLLAIVAIAGAWRTFDRHAANNIPPPEANESASTAETMAVQVFFSNNVFDPNVMECNRTYPVFRIIPRTSAVGRASLEELLKGPTAEENAQGYLTSLNDGARVNSLSIRDGVAYVDFDARLEEGAGGSCRVAAIRSQITNTLKQFSTVKEVVISVEGRVEDALQP